MNKYEYFPRKKLFEESQDIVATFYSKGDYISNSTSEYSTMLTVQNDKDVNSLKLIYKFSPILIEISIWIFEKLDEVSKFTCNSNKGAIIHKAFLNKKKGVWGDMIYLISEIVISLK